MKEQIKFIFFDVDGTLIDMQKKEASPKILDTLYRLKEREREALFYVLPQAVAPLPYLKSMALALMPF